MWQNCTEHEIQFKHYCLHCSEKYLCYNPCPFTNWSIMVKQKVKLECFFFLSQLRSLLHCKCFIWLLFKKEKNTGSMDLRKTTSSIKCFFLMLGLYGCSYKPKVNDNRK